MKNVVRVLLFPVALYLAIYWTCYEIFWWATIEEDSPFTRSYNLGDGRSTPIEDAMKFARDLMSFGKGRA